MHFTVGSASGAKDSDSSLNMRHELSMVKAALLYADEINLCSIGSSIMSGFIEFHELTERQFVPLIKQFGWERLTPEIRRAFDIVYETGGTRGERRKLGKREKRRFQSDIQTAVSVVREQFGEEIEEWIQTRSADGLQRAVSSGIVKIHPFTNLTAFGLLENATSKEEYIAQKTVDEVVFEYVEQARLSMVGGSSYPMFDTDIAGLVEEMVAIGLIAPTPDSKARGQHGNLAGDLLQRLPCFDEATVDEILDIKKDLERPLRGFRQAITEFTATIKSAAWDKGFGEEVDSLFREQVEPRIRELEEELNANQSLKTLAWGVTKHGLTTGSLGAVIGAIPGMFEIAQVSLTAGAKTGLVAGGTVALLRTGMEKHEQQKKLEGNQLYFYYAAGKQLDSSH